MTLETIVITGANGQVGRQVLTNLQGKCQASIALIRSNVELPATKIITNWTNSSEAKEAIFQADVIVHLAGTLKPQNGDYQAANIKPTETLISHLNPNHNQKIIFLSYVNVSPPSSNPYLAVKATCENLLQNTGCLVTIFRCSHIIGSPEKPGLTAEKLISNHGKPVAILGSGKQQITPIYLGDVVNAIIAAIEQDHPGIFDLVGLESMTMDDLVKIVNNDQSVKISHLPSFIARLLPLIIKDLPLGLIDVMLNDSIGNSQKFRDSFQINLTSLREIWR
jgi:nucleoside-diphosphate-sugar epimerase